MPALSSPSLQYEAAVNPYAAHRLDHSFEGRVTDPNLISGRMTVNGVAIQTSWPFRITNYETGRLHFIPD